MVFLLILLGLLHLLPCRRGTGRSLLMWPLCLLSLLPTRLLRLGVQRRRLAMGTVVRAGRDVPNGAAFLLALGTSLVDGQQHCFSQILFVPCACIHSGLRCATSTAYIGIFLATFYHILYRTYPFLLSFLVFYFDSD